MVLNLWRGRGVERSSVLEVRGCRAHPQPRVFKQSFFRKARMACNPGSGCGWQEARRPGSKPSPAGPPCQQASVTFDLKTSGGRGGRKTVREPSASLLHVSTELLKYSLRPSMLSSEVYKSVLQVLACWSLSPLSFMGLPPILRKRKTEAGSSNRACPRPHNKLEAEARIESRARNPN